MVGIGGLAKFFNALRKMTEAIAPIDVNSVVIFMSRQNRNNTGGK